MPKCICKPANNGSKIKRLPRLMAITDGSLYGKDLLECIEAVLAGGMDTLQLREKLLTTADLFRLARQVLPICRRYGALLLINGRADVSLAVGADGVHLGGDALSPSEVRRLAGRDFLIGFSAHACEELLHNSEADYATISPVYPTLCKPGAGGLGLPELARVCMRSSLPLLALGGISSERLPEVAAAGAVGAAFMSALFQADDPQAAAGKIKDAWIEAVKPGNIAIDRGSPL
ncbi:MAG: thiamine phosphate synthase [bacterium]|nr:thiamine phosphate synthase [bacterium]MDD4152917.1 thiamine phosphate synthase [bacterium]